MDYFINKQEYDFPPEYFEHVQQLYLSYNDLRISDKTLKSFKLMIFLFCHLIQSYIYKGFIK